MVVLQPRVLILGSCGMDRLLTVQQYPRPEEKVRTTSFVDVGGGNAANVAHTAALILGNDKCIEEVDESAGCSPCPMIELYTKVGDDPVGDAVRAELISAGVALNEDTLFSVIPDTTTGFTTVIVGTDDQTRTCIHTPGTCGEWTATEISEKVAEDEFWTNVCHFHSDARHTGAALAMARQAKKRNIRVSLDVEKDRGTKSLDELLVVSDIVFTNALQIDQYLSKLNGQLEQERGMLPLPPPTTAISDDMERKGTDTCSEMISELIYALRPSTYFTRWFEQMGKEVVITKGNKGSIHVICKSVSTESPTVDTNTGHLHEISLSVLPLSGNECKDNIASDRAFIAKQRFIDRSTTSSTDSKEETNSRLVNAVYEIRTVGIWPEVETIVDTTGAGDSYLGGYLSAMWWSKSKNGIDPTIEDCMRFGTWVSAMKIQGPGSRTALPTREQRDNDLGLTPDLAFSKLRKKIGPFGGYILR